MAGSQSPTNAADRPRLTEAQKKENHIRSEQKRREAIREGFDRLASIVPGMEGQGRSEAVVLDATVKHLREQIVVRNQVIKTAQAKGIDTTGWALSDQTLRACETQLNRVREEEQLQNGMLTKD
jgi:heteromeric Ino2p/Ino4p transcription factor